MLDPPSLSGESGRFIESSHPNRAKSRNRFFILKSHNMGIVKKNRFAMADPNLLTLDPIRPETLQAELGIKKDAYYAYLKHLKIKPAKDSSNKTYLSEAEAEQVRALRQHCLNGGKIEDFSVRNDQEPNQQIVDAGGELVTTEPTAMTAEAEPPQANQAHIPADIPLEQLIREAARLRAQELMLPAQMVRAIAAQMTYEDLPDDIRAEVDAVRQEATSPKLNVAAAATDLLNQWRSRSSPAA
ncbi:hypothetical protein ACN4EG_21100 [Alkalinema pantanalense CENA528]|uniref:hypothetical protein n=1 Tax=Alkalinema pantanalense TaxID=1620705 RepID=UPI003D6F5E29